MAGSPAKMCRADDIAPVDCATRCGNGSQMSFGDGRRTRVTRAIPAASSARHRRERIRRKLLVVPMKRNERAAQLDTHTPLHGAGRLPAGPLGAGAERSSSPRSSGSASPGDRLIAHRLENNGPGDEAPRCSVFAADTPFLATPVSSRRF